MDGASLSRFPHLSWLGYRLDVGPDRPCRCAWNLHQTSHALNFVLGGGADVRWINRGREIGYAVAANSFHYLPADEDRHTIVAAVPAALRSYTVFVPPGHLDAAVEADHVTRRVDFHRLLVHDDPILRSCMTRLAGTAATEDTDAHHAMDEVGRRLILRLVQLSGGGVPDWHDDGSSFDRRTLGQLVEYIDAHLRIAPSLEELAMQVGLSPSHFARRFRCTTGLSLHRFVNRRRIRASLDLLRDQSLPLAHAALQLGFANQSHFTRLFSAVTSMTPARYQKQFRRVVR